MKVVVAVLLCRKVVLAAPAAIHYCIIAMMSRTAFLLPAVHKSRDDMHCCLLLSHLDCSCCLPACYTGSRTLDVLLNQQCSTTHTHTLSRECQKQQLHPRVNPCHVVHTAFCPGYIHSCCTAGFFQLTLVGVCAWVACCPSSRQHAVGSSTALLA
jgi:hypothetical protein